MAECYAATALGSPMVGCRCLTPSLRAYAPSAPSILSRSRPPPLGPLRNSTGASVPTRSSVAQAAEMSKLGVHLHPGS